MIDRLIHIYLSIDFYNKIIFYFRHMDVCYIQYLQFRIDRISALIYVVAKSMLHRLCIESYFKIGFNTDLLYY